MKLHPLRIGKLPAELLRELLAAGPSLPPEVRLGPRIGEDACAIDVPCGTLVAACDPITFTGRGIGSHVVWVNANDIAVMGIRPRWFLATILLPEGTAVDELTTLFEQMHQALKHVGAVLVGGHTEVTPAVRQPVVAGQMLGLDPERKFVPTGGLQPGDVVLQVGPAPVEGAAVLALEAGAAAGVEPALLDECAAALDDPGILVVEPALRCAALGARALHDPTEGGLAAGLAELAEASGVRLCVERESMLWFMPGLRICRALGANPWNTLASGALLAGFEESEAQPALRDLEAHGYATRCVASVQAGHGVVDTQGDALPCPARDEVARILASE